jgi:hypothetical protein
MQWRVVGGEDREEEVSAGPKKRWGRDTQWKFLLTSAL